MFFCYFRYFLVMLYVFFWYNCFCRFLGFSSKLLNVLKRVFFRLLIPNESFISVAYLFYVYCVELKKIFAFDFVLLLFNYFILNFLLVCCSSLYIFCFRINSNMVKLLQQQFHPDTNNVYVLFVNLQTGKEHIYCTLYFIPLIFFSQ